MSVAFDAAFESGPFTVDTTYVHTPVGTPKCVVLLMCAYNTTVDRLVSASYGGVAFQHQFLASPLAAAMGAEFDGYLYLMTLRSGIPGGPQTVAIDLSSSPANMSALSVTLTASRDTAIEATFATSDEVGANPSLPLTGIDEDCFCIGHLFNGQNAPASVTPGAGMTELNERDFGNEIWSVVYRTTNPTADTTLDWTVAAADWTGAAIAVREVVFVPSDPRSIIVAPSRAVHRAATW